MLSDQKHDSTTSSNDGSDDQQVPSLWGKLTPAPSDPVFGLIHFFLKDPSPKKVLLGVGAYRDDDGKPVILDVVKKAEKRLFETEANKEYAFPDGIPSFRDKAMKLAYGEDHPVVVQDRIASMQTVSGTGALHLGFKMVRLFYPK